MLEKKLAILADAAKYDASCASSGSQRKRQKDGIGHTKGMGICHSYTPDGRCVSLLKILFTNFCIYDCQYCINRISSPIKRAKFTVEEVVNLTLEFYRRNYIEGLFLSSGVIQDPDYTMNQLLQVAKKLRIDHRYGGYIHLKAVPGASAELLEEASQFADRLSANIELSEQQDLDQLAPGKNHKQIEKTMDDLKKVEKTDNPLKRKVPQRFQKKLPAGQSTQLIVGATSSSDLSILSKADELYRDKSLRRVYYTAYSPIQESSGLLPKEKIPLIREHRLYQSDWLLRYYQFDVKELFSSTRPNLDLDIDPKLAWALQHREFFPVDLNKAGFRDILRVPGIGVRNAKRILVLRKHQRIRIADLVKLRASFSKLKYFITTADHNPNVYFLDSENLKDHVTKKREEQTHFFESLLLSKTGEI